jgi:hypothetical protein
METIPLPGSFTRSFALPRDEEISIQDSFMTIPTINIQDLETHQSRRGIVAERIPRKCGLDQCHLNGTANTEPYINLFRRGFL